MRAIDIFERRNSGLYYPKDEHIGKHYKITWNLFQKGESVSTYIVEAIKLGRTNNAFKVLLSDNVIMAGDIFGLQYHEEVTEI